MKKSILKKAFFMNLILILSILGTGIILIRVYLAEYYIKEKNNDMLEIANVITSYSIHYTKLYDRRVEISPIQNLSG